MRILYSYNKAGYEAEKWRRDIEGASNETHHFIAFNHGTYADPHLYMDAHSLDRLYRAKDPGLMQMYAKLEEELKTRSIDNCFFGAATARFNWRPAGIAVERRRFL